jgi:hypothetical protein
MVLVGDEAQGDARFGLIGDCARFGPNVPQARKSFWTDPIEHLGDVGHVESYFDPFGDIISIGAW